MELCSGLSVEDFTLQADYFASPPKWHLAHTTWFFEEMILKVYHRGYEVFDQDYAFLFNSYYNTFGERVERGQRGNLSRPSVEEVMAYRAHVDPLVDALLDGNDAELEALVELGIQHEQQHQELLLTDLKYSLSKNPLHPAVLPSLLSSAPSLLGSEASVAAAERSEAVVDQAPTEAPVAGEDFIAMPEGIYEIGHRGKDFCYDNELGAHRVFLESYRIAKALVNNAAYLEFIEAGGYEDFKYWLDEGWTWRKEQAIQTPLYWKKREGQWFHYTLDGIAPLDPAASVAHLSFYEAQAFAAFAGKRLPTEFEWEAASPHFNWGKRWEWCNSAYLPYPGFQTAEGALGEYNGKFMINQMVLRGASVATTPGHSRKTYRNFFHPDARWQYTGLRLAE